jgi:hypothetical protein
LGLFAAGLFFGGAPSGFLRTPGILGGTSPGFFRTPGFFGELGRRGRLGSPGFFCAAGFLSEPGFFCQSGFLSEPGLFSQASLFSQPGFLRQTLGFRPFRLQPGDFRQAFLFRPVRTTRASPKYGKDSRQKQTDKNGFFHHQSPHFHIINILMPS